MGKDTYLRFQIVSILFCFFVMGSIEMVGIASNYIKVSLHLSDTKANILPSLVYVWFLICTIPTGILMNRVGRKNMVLMSMVVLALATLIPLFKVSYFYMVICFIILGISNVCLQASAYPLFSNIIKTEKLAFHLTFGEFVKTFSCFVAPYIAMIGAVHFKHFFGLSWRVLFLAYFLITVFSLLLLAFTKIEREQPQPESAVYFSSLKLLKTPLILFSFIAVMCHVGIDIGTNTVAPKLLMYKLGISLEAASFASALYFIARLSGGLVWTFVINKIPKRFFFYISVALLLIGVVGLYFVSTKLAICIFIAIIGIGNASLFPVIISQAVVKYPDLKNKISILMIMGQFGGAIFPLLMGLALDYIGLHSSITVLLIGIIYLIYFASILKKNVAS